MVTFIEAWVVETCTWLSNPLLSSMMRNTTHRRWGHEFTVLRELTYSIHSQPPMASLTLNRNFTQTLAWGQKFKRMYLHTHPQHQTVPATNFLLWCQQSTMLHAPSSKSEQRETCFLVNKYTHWEQVITAARTPEAPHLKTTGTSLTLRGKLSEAQLASTVTKGIIYSELAGGPKTDSRAPGGRIAQQISKWQTLEWSVIPPRESAKTSKVLAGTFHSDFSHKRTLEFSRG